MEVLGGFPLRSAGGWSGDAECGSGTEIGQALARAPGMNDTTGNRARSQRLHDLPTILVTAPALDPARDLLPVC